MAIDLRTLFDAVESYQEASGFFDRVARHEPKAEPGGGLSAANWFNRVSPLPAGSGLQATTGRIELVTRIYTNMLAEPADSLDPELYDAVDHLMAAYSADFTLGGVCRNIDLLGAFGEPLQGRAGYLNQRGVLYRVFDLVCPLIVNDAWPQIP